MGGGGGAQAVLEIQVEGGGSKKRAFHWEGWIFSGITQLAPTCTSHPLPFKKKTEVGKKRIGYYFL